MATTESAEQRRANRSLAVDEAYSTLEEHRINFRRVVFVSKGEKRSGGFGMVRKAHLHDSAYLPAWLGLSGQRQLVAVKEITTTRMGDPADFKRAFTKEVLVWSRLKDHPGIAKFLGFCADFGRKEAWLISPWEPYGNVSEFIAGRELEVPEKLSLAFDTLDALAFLHQLDPPVCHGDIKSPNVLVNSNFRAVLCDFGLARLYEDSGFGRLESTAGFKGSIRWCSPEVLNGSPRTANSDVYAWAWLVWEIMTGELPYGEAKAEYVIMRQIFESPLPQVNGESRLRECLQLWELMTRCWAVDPLKRPTSAMCKTTFEYLPHYPPTSKTADPQTRPAAVLETLGELESWKGNHKAGLDYLERALHLYEEEGNDKGIASVLRKQAAVADLDSNYVKSRNAASAALEKCRNLRDDIGVADSLFWMGRMGDFVDVTRNLEESLKLYREKGNSIGVARCLRELGQTYIQQGEAEKALPTLEEAVDVASRCGDRLEEANTLTSLGIAQGDLNDMDQAIIAFQKAQEIAKNIGWDHGLSESLCRLGQVKLLQGIPAEAEEVLLESIRVARNSDAGWRLSQALCELGKCFRAQDRHEEAISALEECCTVYQNVAFTFESDFATASTLLADSKSTLGRKKEALAWYDTAIAEWRKGGYEGKASECLKAKDAIVAGMGGRAKGALPGEASS